MEISAERILLGLAIVIPVVSMLWKGWQGDAWKGLLKQTKLRIPRNLDRKP